MKALILVGGFGTRLRPLTFTKPKPLVEFCNEPILEHQVAALKAVGVNEVILAVNYKPESMKSVLAELEAKYSIKVTISLETEPMGTAGPLALAKDLLSDGDPFFVFNSDVTCEYPLADLLAFHRAHGKEGSIMVTTVTDPSKYGVVVHDETGRIARFVEKPQTYVGNHINAGLYVFNADILKRIPTKPTSIEKEIFPAMAGEGNLYAMELPGYWMDIGQPQDYLTGMCMHLGSIRRRAPERLAPAGTSIVGDVLIDPSAKVGEGCVIGPNVVIGPDCVVEDGARLSRCTLLRGARVKRHALVSSSIVGWHSSIGKWARVDSGAVLGEDVHVADEVVVHGAIILPHKSQGAPLMTPGAIIM